MKTKFNTLFANALLSGTLATATLFSIGCGSRSQDPLQNYESLKNSVPAYQRQSADQTTQTQLFSIDNQDSLVFYQGENTAVNFKVRLFFNDNSSVHYNVIMTKGPAGATFTRVGPDSFALRWAPATNLLSASENNRPLDLQLSFVLDPSSSAVSKANLAGYYAKKDLTVTLYKEQDQPIIEKSETNPIKLIPGSEVNADQDVKIQFVAAAKGLHKAQDLKINFERGPQEPSLELAQMDGYSATDLHATQTRSLGADAQGRARYEYVINFKARTFADELQKQIDRTPALKAKFQKGELTAGEALFYISAYNEYSQKTSDEHRLIAIKVNMTDKAGEPKFVGGAGTASAKIGSQISEQFFIKADGARGEVKVNSIRISDPTKAGKDTDDQGKTAEATKSNATLKLAQDGVELSLTCEAGGAAIGEIMGCKTGACVKSCHVQVASNCDAKEGTTNLIISTESTLGTSKQQKDLNFKVSLTGKAANCSPIKATAAATKASGGSKP